MVKKKKKNVIWQMMRGEWVNKNVFTKKIWFLRETYKILLSKD